MKYIIITMIIKHERIILITTIAQSLIWTNNVGMINENFSPVPLNCSNHTHGASIETSPLSEAKPRQT